MQPREFYNYHFQIREPINHRVGVGREQRSPPSSICMDIFTVPVYAQQQYNSFLSAVNIRCRRKQVLLLLDMYRDCKYVHTNGRRRGSLFGTDRRSAIFVSCTLCLTSCSHFPPYLLAFQMLNFYDIHAAISCMHGTTIVIVGCPPFTRCYTSMHSYLHSSLLQLLELANHYINDWTMTSTT